MLNRMRLGAFLTLSLGLVAPVFAQDAPAVPADANKALWCATAFGIVEPQARSAGDTSAADNFKKYNTTLIGTAHDGLKKAGFTDDQVKTTDAKYSDTVNKELTGGGAAEFSIVDCTALVDPDAAAKIQAQQAAPASGGTAAPATPAPATPPASGGTATPSN